MPALFSNGETEKTNERQRLRIYQIIKEYLQTDELSSGYKTASQSEIDAVTRAIDELLHDKCAVEKMVFIKMLFVEGKTMTEASQMVYISYSTAKRWKRQIIELVEKWLQE